MRFLVVLALFAFAACRTNETPENQVNDVQIQAEVKTKLAQGIGTATLTNISVNVTKGVVTLAGTVHNTEEKSKAISIVHAVPKVVDVNDNLQVSSSS